MRENEWTRRQRAEFLKFTIESIERKEKQIGRAHV